MSLVADAKVLLKLLRGMPTEGNTASRLEAFYGEQAGDYDAFRERLLQGRQALISQLTLPNNAYIVELGGGTGRNVDFVAEHHATIKRYDVVDLCPSLLEVARKRAQHLDFVQVIEADATSYQPNEQVDCVICSYSLTMIPDWQGVLANAKKMLKANGQIAVVDFTTSQQQHTWLSAFWRKWFSHDGVYLNAEIPNTLQTMFPQQHYQEHFAKVPYLPWVRVPYYLFSMYSAR